jgi:cyclopropane-fatty-acyl-phospholipid synthase
VSRPRGPRRCNRSPDSLTPTWRTAGISSSPTEFTYSLIDHIFRLSPRELADFSGAKYDGDFSLTLEEAQRRKHEYVAEQTGIVPERRLLDLGCGWGVVA